MLYILRLASRGAPKRCFSKASALRSAESTAKDNTIKDEFAEMERHLTKFEKGMLKFSGSYKYPKHVPERLNLSTLEKEMSKARIRIATILMFSVLVYCYVTVVLAKRQVEEGRGWFTTKFKEIEGEKKNTAK